MEKVNEMKAKLGEKLGFDQKFNHTSSDLPYTKVDDKADDKTKNPFSETIECYKWSFATILLVYGLHTLWLCCSLPNVIHVITGIFCLILVVFCRNNRRLDLVPSLIYCLGLNLQICPLIFPLISQCLSLKDSDYPQEVMYFILYDAYVQFFVFGITMISLILLPIAIYNEPRFEASDLDDQPPLPWYSKWCYFVTALVIVLVIGVVWVGFGSFTVQKVREITNIQEIRHWRIC
ncbi:unnamed protein product [Bursaphelenchus xylophilus]|uniref:(pine wood nematode) hypothetical protein n=1 Tax=Bursaphelenchus xylophilus TaxID=6326 RepID=A0A1I7S9V3_BURXY|nr:unnamed protein product [Bursaphelenchus xylophilus]CAG9129263.1 unnamed protein product [Bursaphelenchus xylophilus]